jgi:hypothetical protein
MRLTNIILLADKLDRLGLTIVADKLDSLKKMAIDEDDYPDRSEDIRHIEELLPEAVEDDEPLSAYDVYDNPEGRERFDENKDYAPEDTRRDMFEDVQSKYEEPSELEEEMFDMLTQINILKGNIERFESVPRLIPELQKRLDDYRDKLRRLSNRLEFLQDEYGAFPRATTASNINTLIKLADKLDLAGDKVAANTIDLVIQKIAIHYMDDNDKLVPVQRQMTNIPEDYEVIGDYNENMADDEIEEKSVTAK